ncbi:transposase [Kaistia granuli]|uniref:transposase n=1 Tax=Kaistia granuli TaxID=363259 RepID=UPI000A00CADB
MTDFEWGLIRPHLPNKPRGVAQEDDLGGGTICVVRTRSPWRDLSRPPATVHDRFQRWANAGIWIGDFGVLAEKSADSMLWIDRSIVRAHQQSASHKGSRPRSFFWRIRHQDQCHEQRTQPARRHHPVGNKIKILMEIIGGWGGIRTHGGLAPTAVFKTCWADAVSDEISSG